MASSPRQRAIITHTSRGQCDILGSQGRECRGQNARGNKMPRLLELCCGSKSVSKYLEAQGWERVTVDRDTKFKPTMVADVRDIDPPNTWKAGEFDVVWSSPPCTFFSIARTRAPRGFRTADQIVMACWDIIRHLTSDPTKNVFWFMENLQRVTSGRDPTCRSSRQRSEHSAIASTGVLTRNRQIFGATWIGSLGPCAKNGSVA